MLHFKKLKWKNFLSTGNYWSEIVFDRSQNTLVVGENGSGKSTMLDALCFALYNTPFRNVNKGTLVNSINQRDCSVEAEFTTDNHEYRVVRGIKPDVFEIYKDGVLEDQTPSVDYQDHLEKFILKLNYKSFTQIVILGSASFTPFMQLKASDRRAIIEDLLDIQIFSLMNKIVKTKLSELLNGKLSNKLLIDACADKITIQERYIAEAQQDVQARISEHNEELRKNIEEITKLNMNIAVSKRSLSDMSSKIADKAKIEASLRKVTQLEAQIENNTSKHKKNIKFFETEDQCPTCTQVIDSTFKTAQITGLTAKVSECQTGLTQLEQKAITYQKQLSDIAVIEQEMNLHEVGISGYENSIAQIERFNQVLTNKLNELQNNHHSTVREQDRLKEHQDELAKLIAEKQVLISTEAYYEASSTLLKDTGIKTKIIRQYLPIINTFSNKYLASMDFFVNFNLDETFKETIKSRFRDEFTYHSFSEGQKQRIDMALMLTWRGVAKLKNSADTNLLILDEIFDSSLDNAGAEELMKILYSLEGTNVFVISHRGDILQDKFRTVIKFETHQNFSRIAS
jgi:DNA repair exonuclease SbcCD ATPase subunit